MRVPMLVSLMALLALQGAARADVAPEWDAVKACLDKNLSAMLPARESADALFRAARAICSPQVDAAEMAMARQISATAPLPLGAISRKVDEELFAYVVRFKAAGGPVGAP